MGGWKVTRYDESSLFWMFRTNKYFRECELAVTKLRTISFSVKELFVISALHLGYIQITLDIWQPLCGVIIFSSFMSPFSSTFCCSMARQRNPLHHIVTLMRLIINVRLRLRIYMTISFYFTSSEL